MITIREIAEAADVSIATVSRAINAPDTVAEPTLHRIQKTIKDLGYAPNKIARSLKSHESKTVGLITSDITNPFLVKILKGAEEILFDAGYTPIIYDSEENLEKENRYLFDLIERRIDGLIFVPVLERDSCPRILKTLPTVFVDRAINHSRDCVKSNNATGISLLVNHLYRRGRRKIALVGGPAASIVGCERTEAFLSVCKELGIQTQENFIIESDFTAAGGYDAACKLLDMKTNPDAIVSANNLMGIGILKAVRDRNVSCPEEIEIATFDELGELVGARYSYIQQPAHEMGAEAARMLLARISGQETRKPRVVQFEPTLHFNAF